MILFAIMGPVVFPFTDLINLFRGASANVTLASAASRTTLVCPLESCHCSTVVNVAQWRPAGLPWLLGGWIIASPLNQICYPGPGFAFCFVAPRHEVANVGIFATSFVRKAPVVVPPVGE